MDAVSVRVKQPREVVARNIDVLVLTEDGVTAIGIVEKTSHVVTFHLPGEPLFDKLAAQYGFKSPHIRDL